MWSPLRAFQWVYDEHRTLSLSTPKGGSKRKVFKIWTISCDNSETVRDRMSITINNSYEVELSIDTDFDDLEWPWTS